MPSVKELEAFVAVVEAGSFEAAARRLNATPPAVSKRISELETELGVRLFERSTRRCHITPRGRTLVAFAQRVLGDIGEIRRTVGERSSLTGSIRIGVPETIAYTQLPEIMRKASADLPQLTVEVEIGVSVDLISKVRTHELDIACVVGPVLDQDLVSEPFWEVPVSWISAGRTWTEEPLTIEALSQTDHRLQQPDHRGEDDRNWYGDESRADRMCATGARRRHRHAGPCAGAAAVELIRDNLPSRPGRAPPRCRHQRHAGACGNFVDARKARPQHQARGVILGKGSVSNGLTAPYRSGPSRDWIKIKNPDSPAMRRACATCAR
jgi:DNA-binding transcriptional LysR family regulator